MTSRKMSDSPLAEAASAPARPALGDLSPEKEQIVLGSLLLMGFRALRFPQPIERNFVEHYHQYAVASIRHSALVVAMFYVAVVMASFVMVFSPSITGIAPPNEHDLRIWVMTFSIEGGALLAVTLCSLRSNWDGYYQWYTSAAGVVALTAIMLVGGMLDDQAYSQFASYGVLYVLIVVYGIARLRLRYAMTAGWTSGVVVLACSKGFDIPVNWLHFTWYFVFANLIGMVLCYVLEHHQRTVYLQGRLLELEKIQLDILSHKLERLSAEDPLTGLANRRHFNEVMRREWDRCQREGQPVSLIFVDVDHFKPFNDHYGHLEGDDCLSLVGKALKGVLNRPGDLAVRYGGEEFVMLLPNTPAEGARRVAVRILSSIDELDIPHARSTAASHVTVSIGVATLVPNSGNKPETLIEQADNAVYRAKEEGRHRVVQAGFHLVVDNTQQPA